VPILALSVAAAILTETSLGCAQKRSATESEADRPSSSSLSSRASPLMAPPSGVMSSGGEASAGAAASALLATAQATMPRRQIIHTGEMTVEVDEVETAAGQVEKIVLAAGGWVAAGRGECWLE